MFPKVGLIIRTLNKISKNYSQIVYLSQESKMDKERMIKLLQSCIPPLDGKSHKGQAGRIGIVGGSLEYTGAPYFAGISALKVGADLVHIFCTTAASVVIKSYSPELIVHPLLDNPNAIPNISPWLDRLHAIVIGPGLGRDNDILQVVSGLIEIIRQKCIPLIIDADGLFLITEKPQLLQNFVSPVILTPNKIEFERLCVKMKGPEGLQQLGANVSILKKGSTDEFLSNNPDIQWQSDVGGSGRRCGGQGDILSGSIATFLHWTTANKDKLDTNPDINKDSLASSLACYGGSILVRQCNERAFKNKGRSMLATDMIEHIHYAFEDLLGK